jgi:hypothetical protein
MRRRSDEAYRAIRLLNCAATPPLEKASENLRPTDFAQTTQSANARFA